MRELVEFTEGAEPDYRFSLANERTFLAWSRTSLALVAAGVAVAEYLPDLGPAWLRTAAGVALCLVGAGVAADSHLRWRRTQHAIRLGRPLPPTTQVPALALGMTAMALLMIALLIADAVR